MSSKVLLDLNLVDGVSERARTDMALWIDDTRIKAIGKPDEILADAKPDRSQIIELGGRHVLPGLINMHVHLGLVMPGMPKDPPSEMALRIAFNARNALEAGVTAIRSTGDHAGQGDVGLREAIRKGYVIGPRIFTSGSALRPTAGHGHGINKDFDEGLNGADEFLRATRQRIAEGADLIKVAISGGIGGPIEKIDEVHLTDDELRAVTWVAHGRGKKVTAHAGPPEAIIHAVEAGFDCMEHGYFLNEDAAKRMAEHGTWLVPTLSVTRCFEFYRRTKQPEYVFAKVADAGKRHWAGFQAALAAGVRIAMGTDMMPAEPFDDTTASVREIEFMVDAGMSPFEALRAATSGAAEWLDAADRIGSLEVGKYADLIAVEGDPLNDISNLRKLRYVMKDGIEVARGEDLGHGVPFHGIPG